MIQSHSRKTKLITSVFSDYGDGEPKIHAINAKVQGFWEPLMGILSEYGCLVGLLAEVGHGRVPPSEQTYSSLRGISVTTLAATFSSLN